MSLPGTKTQNFIAIAILVSGILLCYRAEAGPDLGPRFTVQRVKVVTKITKESNGHTICRAYNTSPKYACALYDVYPLYTFFFQPVRGTVAAVMFPTDWQTIAETVELHRTAMQT